jgi:hypothetical protein
MPARRKINLEKVKGITRHTLPALRLQDCASRDSTHDLRPGAVPEVREELGVQYSNPPTCRRVTVAAACLRTARGDSDCFKIGKTCGCGGNHRQCDTAVCR